MIKFNFKNLKKDLILYIILAIVLAINLFVPDSILRTTCPIRFALGVPCPGCGLTRAFLEVFKGNILKANEMHPFWIPIAILFIFFVIVRYFVKEEKQGRLYQILKVAVTIVAVLMIAFYIYRMIAIFPDAEPMVMDKQGIIPMIMDGFNKVN